MAKFAYADPPYLGQGARHYGALHADAADCDSEAWHKALIERLCDEFPDGWALSLHTPSLKTMLNLCPDDVRVGAWVKPFAAFKKTSREPMRGSRSFFVAVARYRQPSRRCVIGSKRQPCRSRSRCVAASPAQSLPPSVGGFSTGSTWSQETSSLTCFPALARSEKHTRHGFALRPASPNSACSPKR